VEFVGLWYNRDDNLGPCWISMTTHKMVAQGNIYRLFQINACRNALIQERFYSVVVVEVIDPRTLFCLW